MPHLTILYTPDLEADGDMTPLCRRLADTLLSVVDDTGKPVYPVAGVRVLAFPAAHYAVADGAADYGFVYLNLRMARGRTEVVQRRAGDAIAAAVRAHFSALLASRPIGITVQIDEGREVFDAKIGSLHAHFAKA